MHINHRVKERKYFSINEKLLKFTKFTVYTLIMMVQENILLQTQYAFEPSVISLCASAGLILINNIIPNGYLSKHPITPDPTRKQVEYYLLFLTPSFSLSDTSTCFIAIFIWAAILKRKKMNWCLMQL